MVIHEPRTIRMLFSGALEILKANSNKITKAIFIFWIVPAIPFLLSFFSFVEAVGQIAPSITKETPMEEFPPAVAVQMVMMFPSGMLCAFFAVWGYIIMISIAVRYREGDDWRLRDHATEMIKGPMWSMIAIAICAGIAVMVVVFLITIPLPSDSVGATWTANTLNLVLSAVVQTILYVSIPALVHRGEGPLFGVDESLKLTKSYFKQTLGRYLTIIYGTAIIMMALGFIGVIIAAAFFMTSTDSPAQIFEAMRDFNTLFLIFLGFLPMLIVGLFFMIFEPLYRTEVYFDLCSSNGILLPDTSAQDTDQQHDVFDINRYQP